MIWTKTPRVLLMALMLIVFSVSISAEVPNLINYQGRLTDDGGQPINGSKLIKFKIYGSPTGDDSLWSSAFRAVQIEDGLFDVKLGEVVPLPASLFTGNEPRYLGITVDTDAEIQPRTQFISAPYAHHASMADSSSSDGDWVIDGGDVYRPSGYVGIGNTNPRENLVVGNDIGNYSGNRVVIADDQAGVSTGLVIGENNDSRSWILWDVDNSHFTIGTKEGGTNYSNAIKIEYGNVGLQTDPSPDATLKIDRTFDLAASESRYGVYSKNNDYGSGYQMISGFFDSYGTNSYGIYAAGDKYAAYLTGDVQVSGTLSKSSGSFKIDHPLDPANKYLQHSFVESSDMMNIYNGNVILDNSGQATVTMPDWFDPLNKDFRYQLTAIGSPGPNLYIASEMTDGKFSIAGGESGMKVSWQVTGIRQDKWANEHRIEVEIDKPGNEQGYYIAPELYGFGEEKSIDYKLHKSHDFDSE